MEESTSNKATILKKAYAEMILTTAKESAARVIVSDRKSARFHHDLCGTKDEALRLLVRFKQMIDAKTIEAEIISSNQQRQIDVLEAQLHEAEEIITDLRSELRWVRDKLEKAKEHETISSHSVVVVSLSSPKQDVSESLLNHSLLNDDDECGGNDENSVEILKGCDDTCESELDASIRDKLEKTKEQETISTHEEVVIVVASLKSELDANIRNKKLELSRNECTQRIRALESKSSPCVNEEQCETEKKSGEDLSSGSTRCLVHALRAKNAEVITAKPLNALGINKSCKLRRRKKRKWSKGKAKPVRCQSQIIKPCQSESDLPCSKTSMENSDSMETNLLEENEEVDAVNGCKGSEERFQHIGGVSSPVNPTDHMVEACQESNLISINVDDVEMKADILEIETKTKQLPHLNPVVSVKATNGSTDKDLKLRDEAALVKCEDKADNVVVPSTKIGSELVNPRTDSKATAGVSNRISESPIAEGNRLVKYTFQRKRKR